MARTTINNNSVEPLGGPNLGTGTEMGDSWNTVVAALNTMFTEVYAALTGSAGFTAGSGTATFATGGLISKQPGPISSAATNTSQTLASYTIPANTLKTNGQEVQVTAWGTTANNAAPKGLTMNIGGTTVATGTQTGAAYSWWIQGTYMKDSGNAQSYLYTGQASGGSVTQKAGTDTSVDTGTIATNIVASDASAATGNIVLLGYTVEFFG